MSLFAQIVASLVRAALVGFGASFVSRGILTPDQVSAAIGGIALIAVGVLWSVWQKYGSRVLLMTALASPSGTTLDELKEAVDRGVKASASTPSSVPPRIASLLLIGALTLGAIGVSGCGGSTPIPNLPAIEVKTEADLRAAEMKVYGILQSAGVLLNQASILEDGLAKSGAIPPAQDAQLRKAFTSAAKAALMVINDIDHGVLNTYASFKARIDPVLTELQGLQALVQPTGHPRLMAVIEGVAQIAVMLLQPGALGGGR